jgi:hypothetical protein
MQGRDHGSCRGDATAGHSCTLMGTVYVDRMERKGQPQSDSHRCSRSGEVVGLFMDLHAMGLSEGVVTFESIKISRGDNEWIPPLCSPILACSSSRIAGQMACDGGHSGSPAAHAANGVGRVEPLNAL